MVGGYTLESLLGKGGMAEVWLCRTPDGFPVAIKIIDDPESAELFDREILTVASLNHPNIVALYDYGEVTEEEAAHSRFTEGQLWYAMEYVENGSMIDHSPDSFEEVRGAIVKTLHALSHAHARGFVHRDVKPGNLLVPTLDDGVPDIKLADFGVARSRYDDKTMAGTEGAGTPRYMAPEQFLAKTHLIGPSTDLYALGCIILEWVNGKPIYPAIESVMLLGFKHVNEALPPLEPKFEIPDGFGTWLERMTRKVPQERFQFAAEALAALPGPHMPPPEVVETETPAVAVAPRLSSLREYHLAGREPERQIIRKSLAMMCRDHKPRGILLHGSHGVGKTRLAEWIAHRAHEMGSANNLMIQHSGVDFRDDMINAMTTNFRCIGRNPRDARIRVAERLGTSTPDDLEVIIDLMGPFLDSDSPVTLNTPADVRAEALTHLFAAMTATYPMVLMLDDVHLSRPTMALVDRLLEHPDDLGLLIVMTTDDVSKVLPHIGDHQNMDVIELQPLPPEHVKDLVQDIVGKRDTLVQNVIKNAKGLPSRAVQIAEEYARQGNEPDVDEAEVVASVSTSSLEIWRLRLGSVLEEDDGTGRHALEIAACLGREVLDTEWDAAVAAAGLKKPAGLAEQLVVRRIAKWTDYGFRFEDADFRQLLFQSAEAEGRKNANQIAVARGLESLASDNHRALTRISNHLLEGGQPGASFEALLRAARLALNSEHFITLIEYLDELTQRIDQLNVDSNDPRHGWVAYLKIAAGKNGRPLAETEELIRLVLEQAKRNRWYEIRATLLSLLMSVLSDLGRNDEAAKIGKSCVELLESLGSQREAARVRGDLAFELFELGRYADAVEMASLSMDQAEQVGDLETVARNCERLGFVHLRLQRYDEAKAYYDLALELATKLGMRDLAGHVLDGLGTIERDNGDFDDAIRTFEAANKNFRSVGSRSTAITEYKIATVFARRGDWGRARDILARSRRAFERFGLETYFLHCIAALAAANSKLGDYDGIRQCALELDRRVTERPVQDPEFRWFIEQALKSTGRGLDRERLEALL